MNRYHDCLIHIYNVTPYFVPIKIHSETIPDMYLTTYVCYSSHIIQLTELFQSIVGYKKAEGIIVTTENKVMWSNSIQLLSSDVKEIIQLKHDNLFLVTLSLSLGKLKQITNTLLKFNVQEEIRLIKIRGRQE